MIIKQVCLIRLGIYICVYVYITNYLMSRRQRSPTDQIESDAKAGQYRGVLTLEKIYTSGLHTQQV